MSTCIQRWLARHGFTEFAEPPLGEEWLLHAHYTIPKCPFVGRVLIVRAGRV